MKPRGHFLGSIAYLEGKQTFMPMEDKRKFPTNEHSLWLNAVFVFDSSSLLNLYKYSDTGQKELFDKVFKGLENRLFLPGEVWVEFVNGRSKPIDQAVGNYQNLLKSLKSINNQITQIKNRIKSNDTHPQLPSEQIDEIEKVIKAPITNLEDQIKKKIEEVSNFTAERRDLLI